MRYIVTSTAHIYTSIFLYEAEAETHLFLCSPPCLLVAKMVFCTYCGQKCSSAEHLDSHLLTHTSVKPFKCTACHSSFKAQKLLQRHCLLHHSESEDTSNGDLDADNPYSRLIACTACARAKTKCDKRVNTFFPLPHCHVASLSS
ncbi:hypothetical protein BJ546DRAFT_482219 [Cryomyces antarcticus]